MTINPALFKFLRAALFVAVCLFTLLFLLIAEENWRSSREWQAYKSAAQARGELFSFASFIPPPVPDDRNFMMTPLLAPLFGPDGKAYAVALHKRLVLGNPDSSNAQPTLGDWRTGQKVDLEKWGKFLGQPDILAALKKYDAELAEITAAGGRPFSRAPLNYGPNFFNTAIPQLQATRMLGTLFALRAEAELARGQADQAQADIGIILRLADSQKSEPFIINQLVSIVIMQLGVQVLWDGLSSHRFTDSQLVLLQKDFNKCSPLEGVVASLHAQCAVSLGYFENLLSGGWVYADGPPGSIIPMKVSDLDGKPLPPMRQLESLLTPTCLFYQNFLSSARYYDRFVFPAADAHHVSPRTLKSADDFVHDEAAFNPYTFLTRIMIPPFKGLFEHAALAQTACDQASIACALERYRLAHGQYPQSLDALVPEYSQALPADVISGNPLIYKLTDDGNFILYSVGWNETDDGGMVITKVSGPANLENGDWVWSSRVN